MECYINVIWIFLEKTPFYKFFDPFKNFPATINNGRIHIMEDFYTMPVTEEAQKKH